MLGYVGLTDYQWFTYLRDQNSLDEINFWKPSSKPFKAIQEFSPFILLLKSPHSQIAGFGFFVRYSVLPLWLAWDSFGIANGTDKFEHFIAMIQKYRGPSINVTPNENVGCIMLAQPVMFEDHEFIRPPEDWAKAIVSGKTYDLVNDPIGKRIWTECLERVRGRRDLIRKESDIDAPRYSEAVLIKPRLGQGLFRVMVTEAYNRACAVTNEHSLPVLEAAHIRSYSENGLHDIGNGLLLRSDIHKLFDRGYVTVDQEFRFNVSNRLKADYDNGKVYYAHHGNRIHLPADINKHPLQANLEWHRENVFQA